MNQGEVGLRPVDVVILTAIPLEFDAVLKVDAGDAPPERGLDQLDANPPPPDRYRRIGRRLAATALDAHAAERDLDQLDAGDAPERARRRSAGKLSAVR